MKRPLFLILFVFIFAGNAFSNDDFTGHYVSGHASVEIQQLDDCRLKFWINSVVGESCCNIGLDDVAIAFLNGNTAIYKDATGSLIRFKFSKNAVSVSANSAANDYCGVRASGSMNGHYVKKSKRPQF